MAIRVDFFGLDENAEDQELGSIEYDGKKFRHTDNDFITNVFRTPILYIGPYHGDSEHELQVSAQKEPELWMAALHTHYNNYMMRATKPYNPAEKAA